MTKEQTLTYGIPGIIACNRRRRLDAVF